MSAIVPEIVTSSPHPAQLARELSTNLPPKLGGLSFRENLFVEQYLILRNQTKAAKIAYGYTDDNTAAVQGSKLLRRYKVVQEIKRRLGIHILSADQVLEKLSQHAEGDLADILEPDGSINLKSAKRRGKSQLLKKLKVKRRYERDENGLPTIPVDEFEYEIHDPQAALEKLGRFHALFTDKSQQELSLNPSDINKLSESLVSGLLEAAARKRAEELGKQVVPQLPVPTDVTLDSSTS